MDKKLIVGGLAVVGGLALVIYLLKPNSPRKNSDGFFGANGRGGFASKVRSTCKLCKDSETGGTYQNWNGICDSGDTCVKKVSY